MAGRIRDEDVVAVREQSPVADVIGEHVQLRSAGGGQLKGLCPFHDEKSPSFNVSPSRGFWHCLAGETGVLTDRGVRPIRELAGGTHRILSRRADWVEAPFRSYGVQPLLRITVTRNRQRKDLYATSGHRWFVRRRGSQETGRAASDRHVERTTTELKRGDRLAYAYPRSRLGRTNPSAFGIAHGIVFGDGTRQYDGSIATLDPGKDAALLKYFPHSPARQYGKQLRVFELPGFFRERPSLDESGSYLYGFLAGWVAADGHVAKDGTVSLNSADVDELRFARDLCTRLGIGTFGITTQIREGFPGREPSAIHRIHFVNEDLTEDFFLLDGHRMRFAASHKQSARRGWVVQSVEETDRVEEVFCAEVADGHAFVLEDNILTGNCFGCAEGGDVITFVRKIDHCSFSEAVEKLARRAGVELHYEGGGAAPRMQSQRSRIVAANAAAAEYYAEQLSAAGDARVARDFLTERGFDAAAAERFGCGYAPAGWDALLTHLTGRGFTRDELLAAGLTKTSARGTPIDVFRGRLLWPIRDLSGDVVGFGARRLREDDPGPKYLNTGETPVYKKSQVLYGLDLARREIARRSQAVVVEGYTDVMACHLAGVPTAVATCGTAFGAEHAQVLRRLLMDQDEFRGEVVFTFDGDAAGQKAALRAFEDDQRFVAQTFVAVEPTGLDPCDLRQQRGDAAVRDLVASRQPLFEFALRSTLGRYDLETAEGRVAAMTATAPLVARIRDRSLRPEYARRLAGWLGTEVEDVLARVAEAGGERPDARGGGRPPAPRRPADRPVDSAAVAAERELLKVVVQRPVLAGPAFDAVEEVVGGPVFTDADHQAVRATVAAAGGTGAATPGEAWVLALHEAAPDDRVRSLITALAVEPLRAPDEPDERYAHALLARVQELALTRAVTELKGRLQRMNPVDEEAYGKLFGELVALEQHKRAVRDRLVGEL